MKIRAGRLNRRVTLLAPVIAPNPASGEIVPTWQPQGERWAAELQPMPGNEETASQLVAKSSARLLMRLDPMTKTIRPTWRVRHADTDFEVIGATQTPEHGSVIVFIAGLA
jgi:head-tail adaptor